MKILLAAVLCELLVLSFAKRRYNKAPPPLPECTAKSSYKTPPFCWSPTHTCLHRKCRFTIKEMRLSTDPPKDVPLSRKYTVDVKECRGEPDGRPCSEGGTCSCRHEFKWILIETYVIIHNKSPFGELTHAKSMKRIGYARVSDIKVFSKKGKMIVNL
uniref:uncharacterized protein LOC120334592 isoform X1 n=1 Tax=Styela clava TaxID=7725 RepID=UPI00193AD27C|nr:uncharacterized protein LOC120334592 isoform X1 [Styela clava]